MAKIFISYSRVDTHIMQQLAGLLSHTYDYVWYDTAKIVGGDDWWQKIITEIHDCDHFIYLISRDALESQWCLRELEEAEKLNKNIIPVQVRDRTEIPKSLSKKQIIPMYAEVTVDGLNQIYAALVRNSVSSDLSGLDTKRREADLRLLERLWPLINSVYMDELGNSASNQWILRERYSEHIIEYLRVRNINRPENKFHHAGLETVFSGFDAALSDFSHFLGGFYAADKNTDYGSYLVPNANDKYSQWARESQKQLMVKYFIAEEQHKKVVGFVRKFMPEFEFATEHGR